MPSFHFDGPIENGKVCYTLKRFKNVSGKIDKCLPLRDSRLGNPGREGTFGLTSGNTSESLDRSFLQMLQANVTELHLHRRTSMQLKRNQAMTTPPLIFVPAFAGRHTVDFVNETISAGDDVIRIPVLLLDFRENLSGVADGANNLRFPILANNRLLTACGQPVAQTFLMKITSVVVVRVEVGLITAHNPTLVFDLEASILDATVTVKNSILQRQLKVTDFSATPDDERFFSFERILFSELPCDGSVFN